MNIQVKTTAPGGTRTADARNISLTARGGSCIGFEVVAGDTLTLINAEGLQPGELLVLSRQGIPAAKVLVNGNDLAISGRALETLLAGAGADAFGPRAVIAEIGAGGDNARIFSVFDTGSAAGKKLVVEAVADCFCVLFAPGGGMTPDSQDTATDLKVEIETNRALAGKAPPPLATPAQDIRIKAATASTYHVKKGDYIQIIDVDGRQCSDFLAFDAVALEHGQEYGLDHTTTHTIMGSSYPGPGLHSKYYDERTVPLIEIVRDTVGRHDTFMLACSAKYYDDLGYPGHSNCTDNFNAVLAKHNIKPRKGWPAINFFYNTVVNEHNQIISDAPWSRPGDYVLVRALTDLVCASSSCADDIDPSNGWLPTDIHIFVYDASCNFSKGIAHRMTPEAEPHLTRETAFHSRTSALTRKFTDYRGFWLADCYSDVGPIEEYWACRENAVVMDLSALRKFEVTGPDAETLMQLALTRDIKKLAVGQIVYTAMCYETGGMLDDGTVFRLGVNNFRWVCGDDYCGVWLRELAERHGLQAFVRSSTDQLHNLAVQGPKSRDILKSIVFTQAHQPTVEELKWFRFTIGRIGGEQGIPVIVSRTGYTGELGYEVWCHPDRAGEVWDAIWEAGRPHGLKPMGLAALDMVRIEAGLVFAQIDFNDQIDPFEAGIGFTVAGGKQDQYIGSEALARRLANPAQKLVGLDIEGAEPIHHGDPIYSGRSRVGVITSATRSPILGKTIALARVDVTKSEIGTQLEIGKLDGHQKRIPVSVVRFAHFDPEKTRVRA